MGFVDFMKISGLSKNTRKSYLFYLNKLVDIDSTTDQELINDFCLRYNNPVARSAVRLYFKDYLKMNELDIPRMRGRKKKRMFKWLTEDEIDDLYVAAKGDMRLIIRLAYKSGLRISEILSLTPNQLRSRKIIGKGDKEDTIYVDSKTERLLEKFIKNHDIKPNQRIFNTTRFRVNIKMARLSGRILHRRISPHMLRHSCGMILRQKGMDIMQIKTFLRHEKIDTTAIYATATDKEVGNKWKEIMD